MDLFRAIILGIIQGLTEFVPVSSSAHLVLVPWALRWPEPSVAFDAFLHWGTLSAILVYFWRDWLEVVGGFFRSLTARGPWNTRPGGRLRDPGSRLAWWLILGSIPAALFGLLFKDFLESLFSSPAAVGAFLLVTALILALSERFARGRRMVEQTTLADAAIIGVAQAIAIAPGISRSGATIASGISRGLSRDAAARFSFLLGAPAILGAGLLQLMHLVRDGGWDAPAPVIAAGFLASAITGYLCINFLLGYLRRGKLYIFAVYCLVIGVAVLIAFALR
jgi:undecaprenyl-diphosphatase